MAKKKDYPHSFWEEYTKAESFERKDMLKKLPMIAEILNRKYDEFCKDDFERIIVMNIQAYIDDLIEYMNTKNG